MKDLSDSDASGSVAEISPASLLAGMPFPALIVSPEDTIIASNPSADSLFGLTPASKRDRAPQHMPEGRWSDLWRELRQVAARSGDALTATHWDANHVHLTLTPVESASHHVLGVLVLAMDPSVEGGAPVPDASSADRRDRADADDRVALAMSELGSVKSRLYTLGKEMEAIELGAGIADHKSDFLAMLGHELRNPLSAI